MNAPSLHPKPSKHPGVRRAAVLQPIVISFGHIVPLKLSRGFTAQIDTTVRNWS